MKPYSEVRAFSYNLVGVFLLGLVPCLAAEPPEVPIAFASLGPGEELVVKLSSWGCFDYFSKHKFVFRAVGKEGSSTEVTVRDIAGMRNRLVGSRRLDPTDLGRLDNLIAFYRDLPEGHICTSVDQIEFALYRGGKQVAKEQYRDGTCQSTEQQGLMTLWQVISSVNGTQHLSGQTRPNHALEPTAKSAPRLNAHR